MNVKKDIRFRVYVTFTCICLLGAAIIGKAAYIQVKEGDELREEARKKLIKSQVIPAERGNIFTEDGQILCSSIPEFNIHLDMPVVQKDTFNKYVDSLSRGIFRVLGEGSPKEFKALLIELHKDTGRGAHYYTFRKKLTPFKYLELAKLPIFKLGPNAGGFIAERQTRRVYPYEDMGRRVIGIWRPNAHSVGLEGSFDSVLRGTDGSRLVEVISRGIYMPVEGTEVAPIDGKDLVTTIDLNIQNVAEYAVRTVVEENQCQYGTAIVMEVETGKIRAMVNLGRDSAGNYSERENYALKLAEPGSTFKLVTLLSLLNDGLINIDNEVDCNNGIYHIGNRAVRDSHGGLGKIPIKMAFAHSSNVGLARLAFDHYFKEPQRYIKHLEDFGIDKPTGIDLKGETPPYFMKPGNKHWNSTMMPFLAIGYGQMISPLRTCMLYNGVANGGKMMKPYLISGIRAYGREVEHFEPTMVMQMADSSVISKIHECTEEVILSGTGSHIKSPHYGIAGKTGTAQVADYVNGTWYGYKSRMYQASFVGYFPVAKPKYTICVVIRTQPHTNVYYGGTLAAPVFRMISDRIFASGMGTWSGPLDSLASVTPKKVVGGQATWSSYQELVSSLGLSIAKEKIRPGAITQVVSDTGHRVSLRQQEVFRGQVPDVSGMGLRDAIYLLESSGLRVEVQGAGVVRSQSIAPGTRAVKGQLIILQLNQA